MQKASYLSDAQLLSRLVAFDSTSRNSNLPIADFLCDYLDRDGIRVERRPSATGDKANLIVSIGPQVDAETRAGLVLSGHMDVVPAEEPEWSSDPFELVERDGAYFGRGACDMKGFVALAVNLAVRAVEQPLRHPLTLVLTYDEEVGTKGARELYETWPADRPLPRRAIIGEPTSLAAVRLHKGHASARLVLTGKSAHSGYPHLGDNAIEPAGRVISALTELRQELASERPECAEFFPEVPFVALNIARIAGGTAINIVPDRCQIDVGLRVLPGTEAEALLSRVRAKISAALGEVPFDFELLNESPPMSLAEDSDLYRTICGYMAQTETCSASYATDAGWLQKMGMDCLLWGPGTIAVAHRPNESIPIDEYERGAELLARALHDFCVRDP